MSEELDKKIAERVMGEPAPLWPGVYRPTGSGGYTDSFVGCPSEGGNWEVSAHWEWKPLPFSTSLDLAMKAWHRQLGHDKGNRLLLERVYDHTEQRWVWKARHGGFWGTLPAYAAVEAATAVCNLLLALVEKK